MKSFKQVINEAYKPEEVTPMRWFKSRFEKPNQLPDGFWMGVEDYNEVAKVLKGILKYKDGQASWSDIKGYDGPTWDHKNNQPIKGLKIPRSMVILNGVYGTEGILSVGDKATADKIMALLKAGGIKQIVPKQMHVGIKF